MALDWRLPNQYLMIYRNGFILPFDLMVVRNQSDRSVQQGSTDMKLLVLRYQCVDLAIVLSTWSLPAFLHKFSWTIHCYRPVCLLILALRMKYCQSFCCTNLTFDVPNPIDHLCC